jgi:phosphohistidine phosphatase SixA
MFNRKPKRPRVPALPVLVVAVLIAAALVAAVAACGDGGEGGDANAFSDREERTTGAPSVGAPRGERLVSALRDGGYVIYLRHTATDWTEDDEHPVELSDCDTQRNLSPAGRGQARAIGEAFERLEIPVGRVLSSPFCRAVDTAQLAFGRAESEPALENLESVESDAESELRTGGLRRLLSTPPGAGANTVLSGHGYNIQAIAEETGTAEGDAEIFRPERGDGFALVATLAPADWGELAERFGGDG